MTTLKDLRDRSLAEQGKAPDAAPLAAKEESTSEHITSKMSYRKDELPISHPTGNTVSHITGNPSYPQSIEGLDTVDLPTEDASVRRFLGRAGKERTKVISWKLSEGVDRLVNRWLRENWKRNPQKQEILKRGLQLALYELYTGKELVNFDEEGGR